MADLLLKGAALKAAVMASRTTLGRAPIMGVMRAGHELSDLMAVDGEHRGALPPPPKPIRAKRPRRWDDAELPAPEPAAWRVTSRRLRDSWSSGDSSPAETLEAVIDAVQAKRFGESTYSPYLETDWERARQAAAESTERWRRGEAKSALDGVLIPVKDELHLEGLPTRGGTGRAMPPEAADAPLIARLREVGAIPYAKTHSTEWGMCPMGTSAHYRLPRNPYNRARAAGGSSTGTAVAVALGHSPVGIGSDGGGSIRIPSSLCGLSGIKPTFGRVLRVGSVFNGGSVSALGPLANSTEDLAEFLALTGFLKSDDDPTSKWAPHAKGQADLWRRAIGRGVRGARIGVPVDAWKLADPRIAALGMSALSALEAEGAEIVELPTTLLQRAQGIGVLAIGPETMALLDEDYEANPEVYSLQLQLTLNVLRKISAQELMVAQRLRNGLALECAKLLADVDVIAMPATAVSAAPYHADEGALDMAADDLVRGMCRFNFVANVTGLPAGAISIGMVDDAPVGIQFVGDAWDEASVLACLAQVERLGMADLAAPSEAITSLGG